MIIAEAPTEKVCLSSLFFWNPGRGSILINAHHVFFSTLVLSCIFFNRFFIFIFEICPWVACDAISRCLLLFSIWYIYALPSRERVNVVFFNAVTWWRAIVHHRLFRTPTPDVIYMGCPNFKCRCDSCFL